MALTGFDPDLVSSSISNVQSAYNDLIQAIGTEMQTRFVNGMEDKWACNEAQKFFQNFKGVMDPIITESNNTFQSVVDSMNSAASNWASQTGTSWGGKQFSRIEKQMDVSGIKENLNGVRGVDIGAAPGVAQQLPSIANSAINALSQAQQAVQNCGFVGGNQEASLIASLGKIKSGIESAVNEITDACSNAINVTAEKYGTLETNVSNAFSGN